MIVSIERAEQVGVGVVDVVADERQPVAAAAQAARDADAGRARDPRAAHDLQVEARAHAVAGAHLARQVDAAQERLVQAAVERHARR